MAVTSGNEGPSPIDSTGLCMLSLDGGGVRGLSSLYILKCIMTLVNSERHGAHLKPCDLFDLIGGTSTGGLIAIMLGRLEMDVDECIGSYRELMECVFSEKSRSIFVDMTGNVKAQYDSKKLRKAIEHVVKISGQSPDDLMNDGKARRCKVFVCATAKETLEVTRLRSYDPLDENGPSPTICEAALATSAATRFFDPVSLGDRQFVDGAFGANNPVEEVEEEACDIWCPSTRNLQDLTKCLISIGTGHAGKQALDDNLFRFLSKTLVRMATKPAGVERRFMARWRREYNEKRCFRFNVEEGLENVHMADYQKRSLIETATHDYLHHPVQKSLIRDCTLNLARKKKKTDLDFSTIVQKYNMRAMRIQIENDVNRARKMNSATRPPAWIVPFERNPHYVDREILKSLKDELCTESKLSATAIYGLGGVGKTQIALELAHQIREDHPDCSIFWILAMSTGSIHQAYLNVAHSLGVALASQDTEDVAKSVRDHFNQRTSGRWFLIFDNADDIGVWNHNLSESNSGFTYRDSIPNTSSLGRILFTTRSMKVAQTLASQEIFHIPELDQKRATRVLKNFLINKELLNDQVNTQRLLERLTFLPLAIAQAAAFMNENSTTILAYISLLDGLEQDAIDLLSEDFEDKGRYRNIRNPVATTWLTSFEQIRKQDPLAARYLSFMSCLSSRNIPISLLPSADPVEQERAIGSLRAYSLVSLSAAPKCLELHRLVHLAMRNSLRLSGTLEKSEEEALHDMCSKFPTSETQNRKLWRDYLPHALHILANITTDRFSKGRMYLQWKVAMSLHRDGRLQEALSLTRAVVKYREKEHGPEHLETLMALEALVLIYSDQSRHEEARELNTQILEMRLKMFGPESADVAISLGTLAAIHNSLGNPKIAEWLCISAIKGRMEHFGLKSLDTRAAISVMVGAYLRQGRLEDANELAKELHSLTIEVCGPEGQDTISIEATLAHIHAQLGLWSEAETICVGAYAKHQELLGPHHPATISCGGTLAWIWGVTGKETEAAALALEEAHELERVYGADHENVKAAYRSAYSWQNSKPMYHRLVDRLTPARNSRLFMERRMLYPRVSLYGGLYCPRRQVKDDSILRLIQEAARGNLSQTSTETSIGSSTVSPLKVVGNGRPGGRILNEFEFPAYMKSNVLQPKFCFGGGIFR